MITNNKEKFITMSEKIKQPVAQNFATEEKMVVKYNIGDEEIKLTPNIVKEYIVGDKEAKITNQEFKMFATLCRARKLNPFLREAYCIKYGDSPATIVVGKDAILKRATLHPQFDGFKSGVIVKTPEGEVINRNGCFKLDTEELVGAWCEVFRKDWSNSVFASCSLAETRQNSPVWHKQPCVMIEKTALVRALRSAFVEDLAGMYDTAEMDIGSPEPRGNGFTVKDIVSAETEAEKFENLVEIVENPEPKNKINLEDL